MIVAVVEVRACLLRQVPELAVLQEGEVEKHRIHGLILQADAKQQQVQDSIASRPRGGARDELISELIQSRLAVSRAQMNAEAGVSEQMIEEQQEVIAWLWRILEHSGMTQAQVTALGICTSEMARPSSVTYFQIKLVIPRLEFSSIGPE